MWSICLLLRHQPQQPAEARRHAPRRKEPRAGAGGASQFPPPAVIVQQLAQQFGQAAGVAGRGL